MAKKKITRRDLKKPDEVLTFLGKVSRYIIENQKKVAILFCGIFLIVAMGYMIRSYNNSVEAKEHRSLWNIVNMIPPPQGKIEGEKNLVLIKNELSNLSKTASTDFVRAYSNYFIAVIDLRLSYYNDAVEKYLSLTGTDLFGPEIMYSSSMGLAYSYEALKNFDKAIHYYGEAASTANDPYRKGTALYGSARCYELMGNRKKARETYKIIIKDLPGYPDISFIKIRLSSIS